MVPVRNFITVAKSRKGARYVFASEASPLDPDPEQFDCSELVEWAAKRAHITPTVPDGAYNQWKHCPRISVNDARYMPGALLFVGDGTGSGRSAITHVAISLGDGTTIEARGRKWGVGTWGSSGRFNYGGYLPGVDYKATPEKPKPNQGGGITLHPGAPKSNAVTFMQALLNIVRKSRGESLITVGIPYGAQTSAAVKEFKIAVNSVFKPRKPLIVNHTADPIMLNWLAFCVNLVLKK